MKNIRRSLINVAFLVAVGLGPMLFVVAGIRVAAPDGTVVWEAPKLPSVTVMLGDGPNREPVGMYVVTPRPRTMPAPVRRPVHVEI